jgi:hypothetical protein
MPHLPSGPTLASVNTRRTIVHASSFAGFFKVRSARVTSS